MADCIPFSDALNILKIDLNEDYRREANAGTQKKELSFDTHAIAPDMYYDLFAGTLNEDGNTGWKRIVKAVNNNNVMKKLFPVRNIIGKHNRLYADLLGEKLKGTPEEQLKQKRIIGSKMIARGITMKHVLGSIASEANIQDTLGVSEGDAASLFEDGSRKVGTAAMASAIGRDIAYSMGFSMTGDPLQVKEAYQIMGQNAIEEIESETKLLVTEESDWVLNNRMYKDRFNKYSEDSIVEGFPTVRLNMRWLGLEENRAEDAVELQRTIEALDAGKSIELLARQYESMEDLGAIDAAARYIHRMSVPSNLHAPESSNPGLTNGSKIRMSKLAHELLKDLQDSPGYFNPRVGSFFLHLNGIVQEKMGDGITNKSTADFQSVLDSVFVGNKELMTFIFGSFDETSTTDNRQSAVGQSISKTATIKTMIESADIFFNEDGSPKPQFYEHEMYRTGRVGFVQTVGNPQTDKFFSRFVLDGGEYKIEVGSAEYNQLLNSIKDDSGIDVEDMMESGQNPALDTLIEEYNKVFNSDLTGEARFKKEKQFYAMLHGGKIKVNKKFVDLPSLKGGLWQQLAAIEGIADVRASENGIISTRFQTKPDATGSGIVLQLFQMIGLPSVAGGAAKHLKKLRLMSSKKTKEFLDDVYGFLQKEIEIDQADNRLYENEDAVKFIGSMQNLGFVKNMRDIAKPPTMVTSYLAGRLTVINDMAKEYMKTVRTKLQGGKATQEQIDFVASLIDSEIEPTLAAEIQKIMNKKMKAGAKGRAIMNLPGIDKALKSHISETAGNYIYNLIQESLVAGAMSTFHGKIQDLYISMNDLAKKQDELIDAGLADPSTSLKIKTLPAQIKMDMKEDPENDSWFHFKWVPVLDKKGKPVIEDGSPKQRRRKTDRLTEAELLEKFGMSITTSSQIIVDGPSTGNKLSATGETSNYLTSIVNVIHSMDSAIMFTAHRRTNQRIKEMLADHKSGKNKLSKFRLEQLYRAKTGSKFSIHDASNSNAIYNVIFQEEYQNAVGEVFVEYDMFGELLSSYKIMANKASPENDVRIDKDDLAAMEAEVKDSDKRKQELLDSGQVDLNSEKIFGFSNDLELRSKPKDEEQGSTSEAEPKKKVETELVVEENEIENNLSTWSKIYKSFRKGSLPKTLADIADKTVSAFYSSQENRIDQILVDGEEFVALDIENTFDFSSNVGSPEIKYTGETEILEVYATRTSYSSDNDAFTSHDEDSFQSRPTDEDTYNDIVQAKFDESGVQYKTSDDFSGKTYDKIETANRIAGMIKKLTKDFTIPLLAYNGFKADFRHFAALSPEIEEMLEKVELLDAQMYTNQKLKYQEKQDEIDNPDGSFSRRDQNHLSTQFELKERNAHEASADVLTMLDLVAKLHNMDAETEVNLIKDETKEEKSKRTGHTVESIDKVIAGSRNPAVVAFRKSKNWIENVTKKGINSKFDTKSNKVNISQLVPAGFTLQEAVEHEITHFITHAYLSTKEAAKTAAYRYLKRAIGHLESNGQDIVEELNKRGETQAAKRLEYVLGQKNELKKMSELASILSAEHASSNAIFSAANDIIFSKSINETLLKKAIKKIINAAKALVGKGELDLNQLTNNVNQIIEAGSKFNEQNEGKDAAKARLKLDDANLTPSNTPQMAAFMKKMDYTPYEPIKDDGTFTPFFELGEKVNNLTSSAIANMLTTPENTFIFGEQFEAVDKHLTENFPIYASSRSKMVDYWGQSEFMQEMKGYMNANRFGNRLTMERLMALSDEATQQRGSIDNGLIAHMNSLMSTFTPEEHATIYEMFAEAPAFHLMDQEGTLRKLINEEITLDSVIEETTRALDANQMRIVENMVAVLSGTNNHISRESDAYNLDTAGLSENKKISVGKAIAAIMIKNNKNHERGFELMRKNPNAYNLIYDASSGLKEIFTRVYGETGDKRRFRENLIVDIFEEEYDIEAITSEEYKENIFNESSGWLVLRKPTVTSYGIVYRKSKDETWQEGATTSVSYKNTDVIVPAHKRKDNATNVISTDIGRTNKRHKLVLTKSEKETLGVRKNIADAIYRSHSRMVEIEETQTGRDLLLTAEFTKKIGGTDALAQYNRALGDMKPDGRKWMLGFRDNEGKPLISMDKVTSKYKTGPKKGEYVYANIMKYYKVPERASSVSGFRHNFDLVRKDAAPWLMGYKDPIIFENYPPARKVAYIIRQLVKNTKIVWTALSPTKIVNDNISNALILAGYDVPPGKIGSYGKKIWKEIGEFEKLRMDQVKAKVHGDKVTEARINKAIMRHPMNMMLKNGMLQSINIELYQRDASVVTGLQKDIEAMLNKWVLLPDGKRSSVFTAIEALQNFSGYGVDSILEFAGKKAQNLEALESLGKQLESAGNKMGNLKKEIAKGNDAAMAQFVSEFLMTPSSEAVQLGSMLVQRADIVARGILIRHLIDSGVEEEQAIITATDAFINYKQNMPKGLKLVSDYGVLLFPSFWMRAHKVMLSLIKKNPATVVLGGATTSVLDIDAISTIFDANIVSKLDTGVFHTPPIFGWFQ